LSWRRGPPRATFRTCTSPSHRFKLMNKDQLSDLAGLREKLRELRGYL
jgi:hypothetical protein